MIAGPQFLERPVHVDEELINHRKTTGIRFIAKVERFQKSSRDDERRDEAHQATMTARQRIVIVGVVILRPYLDLSSWIRPEGFARQIRRWDIPPVVRHLVMVRQCQLS